MPSSCLIRSARPTLVPASQQRRAKGHRCHRTSAAAHKAAQSAVPWLAPACCSSRAPNAAWPARRSDGPCRSCVQAGNAQRQCRRQLDRRPDKWRHPIPLEAPGRRGHSAQRGLPERTRQSSMGSRSVDCSNSSEPVITVGIHHMGELIGQCSAQNLSKSALATREGPVTHRPHPASRHLATVVGCSQEP